MMTPGDVMVPERDRVTLWNSVNASLRLLVLVLLGVLLGGCQTHHVSCSSEPVITGAIDAGQLWRDLEQLASPAMEGREPLSVGSQRAQDYIIEAMQTAGVNSFGGSYRQPFRIDTAFTHYGGVNILGWVRGEVYPDEYLVITAHYDHLGRSGRKIHLGADDNASGVAAMLALARQMATHGSRHSIVFVATDVEEAGLYGAKAFLAKPPVPLEQIRYNLNLDMLARGDLLMVSSERGETQDRLVGQLRPQAGVCLQKWRYQPLAGRRTAESANSVDYRRGSDHWAFHKHQIPYLYLGGEEHEDYHLPGDSVDKISPRHYTAVVETALSALRLLDHAVRSQGETTFQAEK